MAYPLYSLASLNQEQGKYEQAEQLYLRALHIWEQSLGPEHALTKQVREDYVLLLGVMKRSGEAEKPEEEE